MPRRNKLSCPSRTIRVDKDVYEWLKSKAAPFKDTPNTVLLKMMKKQKAG